MNLAVNSPRTVIVTGAAGGIGNEIVTSFLARGDDVVAVDMSDAVMAADTDTAGQGRGRLVGIVADVSRTESWLHVITAAEKFGRPVGVLINNAGISPKRNGAKVPGDQIDRDEWDKVLAVNLTGPFLGIQAVAPGMKKLGYGRIVNMSSLAARDGGRLGGVHYAATKTGLLGLTRSFARELAPFGITVNAVAPGRIDAGMASSVSDEVNQEYATRIPTGRLGTATDVAGAVLYLADSSSDFVTGVTLDVNGGSYMG
ncbi:SDR family NAD(P)-dependent oxidoreductase [Cryobacterium sp. PH29-G1]|uniref:SDR family NAD(P)-dependent oxidoreductase n=1 Tax=Cryobacterium sp. PH29-G1 TaxID=3046211 RepID=UPI0024B8FB53|nr:SDR family NAD(P)-dependent oxidoreductase [Cryobacterium sp. PH29-G1]MDJ0350766.1 SDR family NAD(P)-dependent oxidoreductase [Cryobacterium sp. PH29-G1]